MFGVLTVLRRYAAGVPPTAVASMTKTSLRTLTRVPHAVFCVGGTQYHPLSAANAKTARGTLMAVQGDVFAHAHIVIAPFLTQMYHILAQ